MPQRTNLRIWNVLRLRNMLRLIAPKRKCSKRLTWQSKLNWAINHACIALGLFASAFVHIDLECLVVIHKLDFCQNLSKRLEKKISAGCSKKLHWEISTFQSKTGKSKCPCWVKEPFRKRILSTWVIRMASPQSKMEQGQHKTTQRPNRNFGIWKGKMWRIQYLIHSSLPSPQLSRKTDSWHVQITFGQRYGTKRREDGFTSIHQRKVDDPKMYERDWKKNLKKIYAF